MTDKTEAPEQIWINPKEWNKYSDPCVGDPAVPYVPKALLDQKQELFERIWDADMRGIEAWRKANPGNELVMPDRAKMMEWLCGQRFEGTDTCTKPSAEAVDRSATEASYAMAVWLANNATDTGNLLWEKLQDATQAWGSVQKFKHDNLSAQLAAAKAENDRLREALTPSGATKYAYISEFSWKREITDENGDEATEELTVPWTAIKEIMTAISDRAALKGGDS